MVVCNEKLDGLGPCKCWVMFWYCGAGLSFVPVISRHLVFKSIYFRSVLYTAYKDGFVGHCGSGSAWIRIKLNGRICNWIRIRIKVIICMRIRIRVISWIRIWIRVNLPMTSKNVWYMSLFEHLYKVFKAFLWNLGSGSGSALKWKVGSESGSASKWQAGSVSAWES